jgi:glycosyltransferase involved in cell wall biosynthesis
MSRLLVDGVFFQLNNTGIARVWQTVLTRLAQKGHYEILMLDRGSAPRIEGISLIPFPSYGLVQNTAADSLLIQKVCDHYHVDVFTTTYYTTPLRTPMVLMLYDMIPELFGFNLLQHDKMEKELSIAYAQRYVCISNQTLKDLLCFYPEIPTERVVVAHCGLDEAVFRPRSAREVAGFRERYGLSRPYYLFVGTRMQHSGYKNSKLFFDALNRIKVAEFDVLCVGGEPQIEPDIIANLPGGMGCKKVELTDDELSLAYGGARALVYPSLYEGFGMPVVEAMACGCPVITTNHGSLVEAAGSAAHLISGFSADEMHDAILRLGNDEYRHALIAKGIEHARGFRWQRMVDVLDTQLRAVISEARAGGFDEFFEKWYRLRNVQASVDFLHY